MTLALVIFALGCTLFALASMVAPQAPAYRAPLSRTQSEGNAILAGLDVLAPEDMAVLARWVKLNDAMDARTVLDCGSDATVLCADAVNEGARTVLMPRLSSASMGPGWQAWVDAEA